MDAERWQRIEQLYHAAQGRAPEARAAWLAEVCAEDATLRAEVEALLAADEQAGSFMAAPALEREAERLAHQPLSLVGARIHRYRVLSWIGAGGMGEVYLAEDTELHRKVALKLLPAAYAGNADRVRRFAQEARAASALNHPNILTIFDTGTYQGTPFIVAELLEGEELREVMRRGPLPVAMVIDYARQIAAGLAAAHDKGVVHRDLKPANLFVTREGRIKILDFGLAKLRPPEALTEAVDLNATTQPPAERLTREGAILGTVGYMAPEQVRGQEADQRADLFAFGVILYEMLTGERAFQGESLADVLAAVVRDDPPELRTRNPQVPVRLAQLVHHCLAKRPTERIQSARAVSDALAEPLGEGNTAANAQAETAARSTLLQPLPMVAFRRPARPLLLAALLLTVALAYGGLSRAAGWWPFQPRPLQAAPKARAWYEVGTQMLRAGAYYKAKEFLEQSVQEDKQFPLARARLAEALMELDFADEAQRQLLDVATLVPDRSRLATFDRLTLEAILKTVAWNFSGAIADYTRMAALAPADEQVRVYLDLGRAYEKNDEPARAIASYKEALARDPQATVANLRLGAIYGQREKDLRQANEYFQRAEAAYQQPKPNDEGLAEVFFQRGLAYDILERNEEARAQLSHAVERGSPYQAIRATLQLSNNSLATGKFEEAEEEARRAWSLAQRDQMKSAISEGLLALGTVFYRRGDYAKAEEFYAQALESARAYNGRHNRALAQVNLGGLWVQQNRLAEGLREAQAALAYFQAAGYRREALQAQLVIARAQRKQGAYAVSQAAYEQLLPLAIKADDQALIALIHTEIAGLLMAQERYPEALPHIEEHYRINQNLGLKPRVCYALFNRAVTCWQLGDGAGARAAIEEARTLTAQIDGGDRQLAPELTVLEARLALSENNLPVALRKAEEAARQTKGQATEQATDGRIAALQTLGWAQALAGAARAGEQQGQAAVRLAEQRKDERLLADAVWALAQIHAAARQWPEALRAAQQAQALFARQSRRASEWQTWLLLARTRFALGNASEARTAAQQANTTLQQVRQQWGDGASQRYLARPDIQIQSAQLAQLSRQFSLP